MKNITQVQIPSVFIYLVTEMPEKCYEKKSNGFVIINAIKM
jgi:hypothetical protein